MVNDFFQPVEIEIVIVKREEVDTTKEDEIVPDYVNII